MFIDIRREQMTQLTFCNLVFVSFISALARAMDAKKRI